MDICHNCKNKQAEYNCDTCRRTFCDKCDKYIHSFPSKNKHIRRKIFYNTAPIRLNETSRNRYTTDEKGFYIYTGNQNQKYSSIYKKNENPLFEKENENFKQIKDNNNIYGYLSPKSNTSKMKKFLSPNKIDNPKITYNLDYNDENYYNYKYNQQLSLSPQSANDTLNETNESFKRTKSFNSTVARNNLMSYDEKIRLMKKISQLNCELSNARSDIDQKLDILHDH
jgi:hypothetical protein